jgi:hypothetical protein
LTQLRVASVAVAAVLVICGALVIGVRHSGCPHDHAGTVSTCLDESTYSPYVVQGWLLILAGVLVPVLTFVSTACVRRPTRLSSQ